MSAKFDCETKKGETFSFWPEDIIIKPHLNGRVDSPDIEDLIQDILTHGQLQNCIIRKESGKPVLGAGFNRWRAISIINKEKRALPGLPHVPLKLKCYYADASELDVFLMNISENEKRTQTTDLDKAHNCKLLAQWEVPTERIAAIYRRPESWVKKMLKIASCEPEVLKAVKSGRLKMTAAAAIAKLSSEQQREKVKGEGKIAVENPKKKADPEIDLQARIVALSTDGAVPLEFGLFLKAILGTVSVEFAARELAWLKQVDCLSDEMPTAPFPHEPVKKKGKKDD